LVRICVAKVFIRLNFTPGGVNASVAISMLERFVSVQKRAKPNEN